MDLIIGGFASGKFRYAKNIYGSIPVVDEKNYDTVSWEKSLVYHLHLIIRELFYKGYTTEQVHAYMEEKMKDKPTVILSDEIGNGIVPMEEIERLYREETGRILIHLAEQSEKVVRITCGLAQVLK